MDRYLAIDPRFSRLAASIGRLSQHDNFSQKVRWVILKGRWRDRAWSYSVIYGWLILRVALAFYFVSPRHGQENRANPIFIRTSMVFAALCFFQNFSDKLFLIQEGKTRKRRTSNSRVNSFNFARSSEATKARRKQSWKFSVSIKKLERGGLNLQGGDWKDPYWIHMGETGLRIIKKDYSLGLSSLGIRL